MGARTARSDGPPTAGRSDGPPAVRSGGPDPCVRCRVAVPFLSPFGEFQGSTSSLPVEKRLAYWGLSLGGRGGSVRGVVLDFRRGATAGQDGTEFPGSPAALGGYALSASSASTGACSLS